MHRDPDALRREAVSEWMDLYGDQVMHLCFTALRDHHLAQDACQETFFRAWKYFDRFRFESSGRTWLMRIAVNVCRDMKRAKWFRQGRDALPLDEKCAVFASPDLSPGPVTDVVMALPEKYRLVLLLHYVHGFKAADVGRILGVAYPTVLARLKRGRDMARRRMEEGGAKV